MSAGRVIARATLLIMVLSLLSRLLGFGREVAIAHQFGAAKAVDAYLVAYTIPYIFYTVAGVALATVIVPVFSEYVSKGRREEAWEVCSLITNAVIALTIGLAFLGIVAAPLIVGLLGHGFPPDTAALAVRLTMMLFPAIIFFTMAGLFSGMLNANNIFGIPAIGSAVMNLVIIFGALVAARYFGIYGLALGTLGGALAMALVQVPALKAAGFRYTFRLDLRHPEVLRVVYLMLPLTLGLAVNQFYMMIDWFLASGLEEGSIAALNFANKLIQLPQSLFVLAVSTAIFPTLSRQVAEGFRGQMGETLRRGIKVVLLLTVPAGVGILVLREPIVTLLFQRGAFDANDTAMTTGALLFFAIGLVGQCLVVLISRGFFAMQDMKTPVLVSLSTLLVKLGLSMILVRYLAHAGLALGTSVTALLNTAVLIVLLHRRLPELIAPDLIRFTGGTVVAATAMGLSVYLLDGVLAAALGDQGITLLIRVAFDIVCGCFVYFVAGFLLRLDELINAVNIVFRSVTARNWWRGLHR